MKINLEYRNVKLSVEIDNPEVDPLMLLKSQEFFQYLIDCSMSAATKQVIGGRAVKVSDLPTTIFEDEFNEIEVESTEIDTDISDPNLGVGIYSHNPDFGLLESSELDADGVKWDERIHSRTKSKTKDGKWRVQRSVSQKSVDRVISENNSLPETSVIAPPPPPAPIQKIEPTISFDYIVQTANDLRISGKILNKDIVKILNSRNLKNWADLKDNPHLFSHVLMEIQIAAGV